ncbi:MAG: hypothetical protein M5U22_20625 [Thermoleophilia bacterium]|nr:hypothetical protein [Thermoleophilia bacterium]
MYAPIQGLDHLGLATVAQDQVLEHLSPGIRALTIHPRYFSFYAFVIDEFWRRDFPRDALSFKRFYRNLELVYSVGVNACERKTHRGIGAVVGSSTTQTWAREKRDPLPPDLDYIQAGLGGYGLYYRGRMRELEVILGADEDVPLIGGGTARYAVDLCTSRIGLELAEAFRQAVAGTEFYQRYLGTFQAVPFTAVREFGQAGCLCALAEGDAPDRVPLLDMFMHAGVRPAERRASFRYFLDLADQTQGLPVSEDTFRRLVYFGRSGNGAGFKPRAETLQTHRGWRMYQAREYYSFALNSLWARLCELGIRLNGDLAPVPMTLLHDRIRDMSAPDPLARALGIPVPGLGPESAWSEVVLWYQTQAQAESAFETDGARIDTLVNESVLLDLARATSSEVQVAAMVGVLALTWARFGDRRMMARPEWQLACLGSEERLSLDRFLRDLAQWSCAPMLTLGTVVSRLLDRYIITQHLLVASRKMPENTFRFEREADGLRFYQHGNPVEFTNSRFSALSNHLVDLGLCGDLSSSAHGPSEDGRRLLEAGHL